MHSIKHCYGRIVNTALSNSDPKVLQSEYMLTLIVPAIIVERHQSGAFATNASTEAAYQKATAMSSGGQMGGQMGGQAGNYNDAQIQASK